MQYNSDIKFVQPSGGSIYDISSTHFVPTYESEPSLPSGSVFMRANDGQREGFTLIAVNNQFGEMRTVQGCACYFHGSPASPIDVSVDTNIAFTAGKIERNAGIFTMNSANTQVTIHVPGVYKWSYMLNFENTTAGNNDGTVIARVDRNGVFVDDETEFKQYMPTGNNGGAASITATGGLILERGDVISVVGGIDPGAFSSLSSADVTHGTFMLELIRPSGL